MVENMSGIKATSEKETPPEFSSLRMVGEVTAAGVYLSEGRYPNIPLFHYSIIPVVSAANQSSTRETGQLYFKSEMFGQYVSRIFYEINREVRGEISGNEGLIK
jgi:hypothetical protein